MGDEIVISMNRVGIGNIPSENFSREQSSPADVCVIRYGSILAGCVMKFVKFNNELQRNTDQRLLFTFFCCIFVVKKEFVKNYLNH